MARLTFRLDFKTDDLRSLELPVEVRKPNATLITTALTSETVELPAGEYYATTRMPGGQRLVAPFKLSDPQGPDPLQVVLAPDPEDASAHEWEEVSHFLGRPVAQEQRPPGGHRSVRHRGAASASELEVESARQIPHLCVYSGNVIRHAQVTESAPAILGAVSADQGRVAQFEVPPNGKLLIAQLVQPGGPVQNLAMPVSPQQGMRLVISQRAVGEYRMDARLNNRAADLLLQYSSYGAASTAAVASRSQAVNGERLLLDKMADPIAAAVGAYSILRLGDVTRLRDWTAHLCERFDWLPDGAAIYGEHLARKGQHAAAIDAFWQVPLRGLPIFADGLFYAVERLKLYASRTWKGEDRVDAGRAQAVLDELQPFALLMRRRPISAYPGLDVSAPDTTPAPEAFTAVHGLDLSPWFGPASPDRPAGWDRSPAL